MRSILFLMLTVIHTGVFGQSDNSLPKSFIPPSPNAANLGLYTTVPVDMYAGLPNITVPIHTFEINGLQLSVNLSYHAGGIRYSDEGAWVGLGWSLNAGGAIGRTKRDKDDFSQNGFYKVNPTSRPCNDSYDQEPDLFYYNFAGHTGKFILEYNNGSNTPKVNQIIKDGLLISAISSYQWKIIDENGITYIFQQPEVTKDVYTRPGHSETETYVSCWYLTRITNNFGESIEFSYTNTGNKIKKIIGSGSNTSLTSWTPSYLFSSFVQIGGMTGIDYYNSLITHSSVSCSSVVTVDEICLSQITCHYDRLDFITSDRTDLLMENASLPGKKLDKIQLKTLDYIGRPDGSILKTFNFVYDYFNSQSGQPDYISKRLRLNSIQEISGSTSIAPFEFYYTTNVLPDKQAQSTFFPYPNIADGLLNKLVYPTGGYTSYEYEAQVPPGGARVKRISQTDFTGTYNTRYFEYLGEKQLAFSVPCAMSIAVTYVTAYLNGGEIWGSLLWTTTFHTDNFLMGETSSSYLVGYDQVEEYYGASGEYGKTVYTFYNQKPPEAFCVPSDVPTANGFLLSKEDFAYTNNPANPYVLVKKFSRTPNVVNLSSVESHRKSTGQCNYTYFVKGDWVQVSSQSDASYDQSGGNPVTKNINYAYGDGRHIYPVSEQVTDSKNAVWNISNKYTPEKSTEEGGVYTTMLQKNMIKKLETTVKKNGVQISKTKTNYKDWYEDGTLIVPITEEAQKANHNPETRVRYHAYTNNGHPTELSRDEDTRIKYIWGYQNTVPIAEIRQPNVADYADRVTTTTGYMSGAGIEMHPFYNFATLEIDQEQTVTMNGELTKNSGSLVELGQFRIVVSDLNNSSIQYVNNSYSPNALIDISVTLPRGKYNVSYIYTSSGVQVDDHLDLGLSFSVTQSTAQVFSDCFYTSFEDSYGFGGPAYTGVSAFSGILGVPTPGHAGKYKLTYWEKPGSGNWEFKQQIINVNGPTDNIFIGAIGNMVDEVRLHPLGTLMTTYTYDPQHGITSKNDEKNQVTFYEYDELGRLKAILDHQRHILKTYTYKYQENQQ